MSLFTSPFAYSYFTVMSGSQGIRKEGNVYFTMLTPIVWIMLAVTLLTSSALSWATFRTRDRARVVHRGSLDTFSIHVMVHFGTLVGQGFRIQHGSLLGRCSTFMWLYLALILICNFAGGLRERLTFLGEEQVIDSVSDIFKYPNVRVIMAKGSISTVFVQLHYPLLWHRIHENGGFIYYKDLYSREHLEEISSGKMAMMSNTDASEYNVGLYCVRQSNKFHYAKEPFMITPIYMAVRKGMDSSFLEQLSRRLLVYAGMGHVRNLFNIILRDAEKCKRQGPSEDDQEGEGQNIHFQDIAPVLVALSMGLLAAIIAVLLEIALTSMGRVCGN